MSDKILIEKTIFARDKRGVKRQVFITGDLVEPYVYQAILRHNTILNPEDLPNFEKKEIGMSSLHARPIETKVLEPQETIRVVEEELIKEVIELEDEVVETVKPKARKKKAE